MKRTRKRSNPLLPILALCAALGVGVFRFYLAPASDAPAVSLEDVPAYSGTPYVELDGNVPAFTDEELTTTAFESYSPLDALGRCSTAYACVGLETMPTEDRGSIGQVKPSGWQTVKYDCVDGKYLYNRCHLIGYQLTGENANEENLITGTRYLNVDGMLPFEDTVADYVQQTGNHVLYRVTPIFQGNELVARGVQMEALSVEDEGQGVSFNVYVYNVQPGVVIDYATGESQLGDPTAAQNQPAAPSSDEAAQPTEEDAAAESGDTVSFTYTLNTKTKKFHDPGCSGAASISPDNRDSFTGDRQTLLDQGYTPCGQCQP